MKKLITIFLIISVLILTGCTMLMPAEESLEGTAQAAVDDIEESFDEIDALNVKDLEKELDISELDNLEQELDELDW